MSQLAYQPWTADQLFAWQAEQPDRYELVDGFPVRMIAGASNLHDDIVVNLLTLLRQELRGSGCRPFTADGSVETRPGQVRRPDIGVDCGARDPDGTKAALPRLIVEVLSPSTRDFDTFAKLEEYKRLESLAYIAFVEPNAPEVVLWSRTSEGGWSEKRIVGLDLVLPLPELSVSLSLAEIYEGVSFPVRPRLIGDG